MWGIEVDPHLLPDNWGISVVHYVAMFGSTYLVTGNQTGYTIDTNIQHPIGEDMNLKVGNPPRRVFDIGFRGTFDLIDETTSTTIRSDQDAINLIVKATLIDDWLIKWQAVFSGGVMATMAYALSPDLQTRYSGPLDLFLNGRNSFLTSTLWYAVSFPRWDVYRVEHDPAYTAYVAAPETGGKSPLAGLIGLMFVLLILAVIVAVILAVIVRRKKPRAQPPM